MKSLTICNEVPIPIDVVTKRLAFVGTTGSGKSYGAMKLAEEMILAGVQVVVLDPVGIHWGMRLSADRKKAGISITVFGGLYGDVPITPESGALIADVIIDKRICAVIDVSQFEHDSEKARFAAAFAARFYFRKKSKPSPVHLFLEEGQEFVPQDPKSVDTTMQHHFVRMSKIGRNFGIGISIITQRPQEVSKKALNLSQALFAFQTNGSHERKAIEEWMKDKGLDLDIASDLPKLGVGQPHLWSPGWLKISAQVKILPRKTFHPSEEESVTYEPQQLSKLSPVDIAQLSDSIKQTVERAKENDPSELKRRAAELTKKVQQLENAPAKTAPIDSKAIYEQAEAAVRKTLMKDLVKYEKQMGEYWRGLSSKLVEMSIASTSISNLKRPEFPQIPQAPIPQIPFPQIPQAPIPQIPFPQITPAPMPHIMKAAADRFGVPGTGRIQLSAIAADQEGTTARLPEGEKKILIAIAQHPDGVDREQLTVLTGYKRSTHDRYLQMLSQKGYTMVDHDGMIIASQAGIDALGSSFDPLPKGEDLVKHWLAKLPGGERVIFELLVEKGAMTREKISELTTYKRSTRDRYLQLLAARKLIVSTNGGLIGINTRHFK